MMNLVSSSVVNLGPVLSSGLGGLDNGLSSNGSGWHFPDLDVLSFGVDVRFDDSLSDDLSAGDLNGDGSGDLSVADLSRESGLRVYQLLSSDPLLDDRLLNDFPSDDRL